MQKTSCLIFIAYLVSMIHLISIIGKPARPFHLNRKQRSDFKSLLRTLTSGRVMLVSTWFRSDLFYQAEAPMNDAILKAWALYTGTNLSGTNASELTTYSGNEIALSEYFVSVNALALNWLSYRSYQQEFQHVLNNDPKNPVAVMVMQCDRYLTEHTDVKRPPLISTVEQGNTEVDKDTFSLAMRIINNQTHSN